MENSEEIIIKRYSTEHTIRCHQCNGSGKDQDKKEAALCCSCYGYGRIFLDDASHPVNYTEQRRIIQEKDYYTPPKTKN
ncbi:MAG: hypothetical protein N2593_03795 [Patescibacteria group bacterium]|nr:hypothetical protein [Patescibacteria group bacterium]